MKKIAILFYFLCFVSFSFGQLYMHADSLHGGSPPERTSFDVYYYDLNVEIDPIRQSIRGFVDIHFKVVNENAKTIQIDLYNDLRVDGVKDANGNNLNYKRDWSAIFIQPLDPFEKGSEMVIRISYSGKPHVAKDPPWEGGLVWSYDKNGNPWIGVACEGEGASIWWPNKDTWYDEADSVAINITCPSDLVAVSNGNLRAKIDHEKKTTYKWFVSYPINNYNVTMYLGKFANFSVPYIGKEDTFKLDYYVLDYNLNKAKTHFKQVTDVLKCYEEFFGAFPFPKDGYGLVESPYEGMEHQGAIAYGQGYKNNFKDYMVENQPVRYDYIIVHETGHEYWGNSVTGKDLADMWIHEGFCTYTEAIYVEYKYGSKRALKFCNGWKEDTYNDRPIIPDRGVFQQGSDDMYPKGALMLHTLRWLVNDDVKWFSMIKNIQQVYKYKMVSSEELFLFMNDQLGNDYTWVYNQYLRGANAPQLYYELEQKGKDLMVTIEWKNTLDDFKLPVTVFLKKGNMVINVTTKPQQVLIPNLNIKSFKIDQEHSYFLLSPAIAEY